MSQVNEAADEMVYTVGRVLNRFSKDIGYMDDQLQVMFSISIVVCLLLLIIYYDGDHLFRSCSPILVAHVC